MQILIVAADRPSTLRLPVVIIDKAGFGDHLVKPVEGMDVETFTSHRDVVQGGDIILLDECTIGIFTTDATETSGGGVEPVDFVFFDDSPVDTGIWKMRFSLVEDCSATDDERTVDDEGVTNNPSNIRTRKVHISSSNIHDMFHCEEKSDTSSTLISYDTFWHTSGSRCVEDVERVISFNWYTVTMLSNLHAILIVKVLTLNQLTRLLWSLLQKCLNTRNP